jgi:hypothetical protein
MFEYLRSMLDNQSTNISRRGFLAGLARKTNLESVLV